MSKFTAPINRRLFGCLAACLVAGCSPVTTEPVENAASGIHVEGIIIQNGLYYPVTDVMVEVPATGGFAGCGAHLGPPAKDGSMVWLPAKRDRI